MDGALTSPTELWIRGGAAQLALGFEGRVTIDIDILPGSQFLDAELRGAFERLPERFRRDPVVVDNLRYVVEDFWRQRP